MAMTQYRCKNFGNCDKALERETIEIEDGNEPICPECGSPLELLNVGKRRKDGKNEGSDLSKWAIPAAVVVLLGLVVFLMMPKKKPSVDQGHHGTSGVSSTTPIPASTQTAPSCDDRQLADYLTKRFAADEDLKEDHIQVDVAQRTVVLSGNVRSDSERAHAEDLVRYANCPIASVMNQLSSAPSDEAIAKAVSARFASDPLLKDEPIHVAVSLGVVVLSGSVSERSMRANASSHLSQIPGVKNVINNLDIVARQQPPPPVKVTQQGGHEPLPPSPKPSGRPSLTGTWTGTYMACSQATTPISVQIRDAAVDDITASFQIDAPGGSPGSFTMHGVLNAVNGFLTLPFNGWEHQPSGVSMGNIGGYIVFTRDGASSFSGIIRSPGCGQITLHKR